MTKPDRSQFIIWLLLALGIALRVWQFAGGASLHLDEVDLARNIAERSYAGLLKPLDFGQVAPPGFLVLERLLWSLFKTDWSLRLVPLAGAIGSLFLFLALARRALEPFGLLVALACFAIGVPFILYGALVKQYSTDVLLALTLLLMAARALESNNPKLHRYALAGIVGFITTWFSNAAILVVLGVGAALIALAWSGLLAAHRRPLSFLLAPWAVGAAAAALASRHAVAPDTLQYLKEAWRSGFMPLPPWTANGLHWIWQTMHDLFGAASMEAGFGYRYASGFVGLSLIGFVGFWRVKRAMALLLLGPVLATVGAATMQVYPSKGRLVLFLLPIFLIALAEGVVKLVTWLSRYSRPASAFVPLLVLIPPVERIISMHPVYRLQETRPLLQWLASRRQPNDVTFIWYQAVPNLAWYGPRYGLTNGETMTGGCWLAEPRLFLQDLDRVRGRGRVWLVIAGGGSATVRALLQYADTIGVRRDGLAISGSVPGFHRMEAWLYDFSDPARLKRASADSFPLTIPPVPHVAVLACSTGPVAPPRRN